MKKKIKSTMRIFSILLAISVGSGPFLINFNEMTVFTAEALHSDRQIIEQDIEDSAKPADDEMNGKRQDTDQEEASYNSMIEVQAIESSDMESNLGDTAEEINEAIDGLMLNDTPSSRTVTGLVYPFITDDLGLGDEFLRKHDIVVTLKPKVITPESAQLKTTAKRSEITDTGRFIIEDVPYGEYLLCIKKPGYLLRCMEVIVSSDTPKVIELAPPGEETIFDLWDGDVNGDCIVDNLDVMMILEYLKMNIDALDSRYNAACDLNADGLIDNLDIMAALQNSEKDILQYPGAENIDLSAVFSHPNDVTNLACVGRTQNAITLTWKPVNYATQYEVKYNGQLIQTIDTEITIDGLMPGTKYDISVRAVSDDRYGNWTNLSVNTMEIYVTITGLVWPLVTDDLGLGDEFLRKHDIVVTLKPKVITPESAQLKTIAQPSGISDTGRFIIEDVPSGDYLLCIKRPGYLLRCMEVTVSSDSPEVIELVPPGNETVFNLWWGDVDDNFIIDNLDIMEILESMSMYIDALSPDYNPAHDLNGDGLIDNEDTMMVIENLDKDILQYPGAENIDLSAVFDNPNNVTNLMYVERTPNTIALTWEPVNYATQYEVKYNGQLIQTIDTEITIDGLTPATKYDFSVRAVSDNRFGNWANLSVKTLNADGTDSDDTVLHMNVQAGKIYDVVFSGDRIRDLSDQRFNISYDPQMLELINLASHAYGSNKNLGAISGTDIEVVSMNSGKVELRVNRSLSEGQAWSGTVSIVKFKGIKDGESSISFERKGIQ